MSQKRDTLSGADRAALADELSSAIRHSTRNKLAVARNALAFLKRKLGGTEAWKSDERIESLWQLADDELKAAAAGLDNNEVVSHVFARSVGCVDVSDCVRGAVAAAKAHCQSGQEPAIEVDAGAGEVSADSREVTLAIRCLLDNAIDASIEASEIMVTGKAEGEEYVVRVVDAGARSTDDEIARFGQAFFTTKAGHVGLGVNFARRIATRYGGSLVLGRSEQGGVEATMKLPLRSEKNP